MANRERGEVEIVVNEKPYTLRLTTNAICELQNRTKLTFAELCNSLSSVDFINLRELVAATLRPYHAKDFPDLLKVGAFMDDAGGIFSAQTPLVLALKDLMSINQPPESRTNGSGGGEANPPDAQDEGTGSSSS